MWFFWSRNFRYSFTVKCVSDNIREWGMEGPFRLKCHQPVLGQTPTLSGFGESSKISVNLWGLND